MRGRKNKTARFDLTKIDTEHFLGVMEVENLRKATEEEWNFSCPFPGHAHGDQSPSAYMNEESTAWICHGCKRNGNAISFMAELENITFQKSRSYLQSQYGGGLPDPDEYSVKAELDRYRAKKERERAPIEFDVFLPEEVNYHYLLNWSAAAVADEIPPEMAYMLDRGFDPVTLEEWEIGYDEERERITIPIRHHDGRLVGFKGRSWNRRKPKYLVLGGEKYDYPRFHKSRIVFGLDKAIDMNTTFTEDVRASLSEIIICEGELDVISLHEKGFWNAVAVAGSYFSDTQARLIRSYADSAVIFFDSDQGGNDGIPIVIDALSPFMPVKVVPDHEGDPATMTSSVIQKCLDESESVAKIRLLMSGE